MTEFPIEILKLSDPIFITFEGCDGSGKSTQAKLLYDYLVNIGIKVIYTREIGGTPVAEKIRDLVVYNDLETLSQLMMVMAARFEHVTKTILPALNSGSWVICDRFVDSTACYQSSQDNNPDSLSMDEIYNLHTKLIRPNLSNNHDIKWYSAEKGFMPDITFFINLPPEIAMIRALERQDDRNNFDEKPLTFYQRIYDNFKIVCHKFPERFIDIVSWEDISDTSSPKLLSPNQVQELVISKLVQNRKSTSQKSKMVDSSSAKIDL